MGAPNTSPDYLQNYLLGGNVYHQRTLALHIASLGVDQLVDFDFGVLVQLDFLFLKDQVVREGVSNADALESIDQELVLLNVVLDVFDGESVLVFLLNRHLG